MCPVTVVGTAAGIGIEQAAGEIREINLAGFFVFDLVQATQRAAIAKRLPFVARHVDQRFAFPEFIGHRSPTPDAKDNP